MAGRFELVIKNCAKCGHRQGVRPRERRCKQRITNSFGGLNLCYGQLTRPKKRKVTRTLETKLADAHAQLADAITKVKRAVTSVDHWQRKIKAIGRRIDQRDHPPEPKPKRPRAVSRKFAEIPDGTPTE